MTKERLQYLLDRFLNNTATTEELNEYNDWYREQQDKGLNLYEQDGKAVQQYTDQLFSNISSDIQYREYQQQQGKRSRAIIYRWTAAAAVICLLSSVIWYWSTRNNTPAVVAAIPAQEQVIRFTNTSGVSKHFSLPDSSVVELYANSTLYYKTGYGKTSRNSWLTGKGFFKVMKDSTRPFTVYSGNISTTALGTSFTITAWPGNDPVKVLLHTGKVVVQQLPGQGNNRIEPVYLTKGQEVTCDIQHGIAKIKQPVNELASMKKTVSPGSRLGFTATFDQQPLAEVLDAIARGYKVSLQYNKEAFNDMVFSGSIRKTDSLAKVLQRMAALHNLTIKATGKGYNINSNQ